MDLQKDSVDSLVSFEENHIIKKLMMINWLVLDYKILTKYPNKNLSMKVTHEIVIHSSNMRKSSIPK